MNSVQHITPGFEALPDPLILIDPNRFSIIWMNTAAQSKLRLPLKANYSLDMFTVAPGFKRLKSGIKNAATSKSSIRGHDFTLRVGSRDLWFSYLIFPCAEHMAILLFARQRPTQNDETNSEAVSMLGRMLAHELKNPLAGIHGAAQLLQSSLAHPDDMELTSLIKSEVGRIGRLANKMENFDAHEITEFEFINIHAVLRKALLLFQNDDNGDISFYENYDPSLPPIYGNKDSLMQAVVNLIANAVQALKTKDGAKSIEVQTLYRAGTSRRLPENRSIALQVEIRIIDNGPGVPEDMAARVFQPFVTTRANGHGLGLAMVNNIVNAHFGLVELKSVPGRTVFSLLLPTQKHAHARINS